MVDISTSRHERVNSHSDPIQVGGWDGVVAHVILVSPTVPIGLLDLGLLWGLVSDDWTWD